MRTILRVAALSVSLSFASSANAANSNLLYQWCTSADATDKSICFGYVVGALDAEIAHQSAEKRFFQLPERVDYQQITDVLTKYLRDNPKTRDWPGPIHFHNSLMKAWPCPK